MRCKNFFLDSADFFHNLIPVLSPAKRAAQIFLYANRILIEIPPQGGTQNSLNLLDVKDSTMVLNLSSNARKFRLALPPKTTSKSFSPFFPIIAQIRLCEIKNTKISAKIKPMPPMYQAINAELNGSYLIDKTCASGDFS